MDYTQSQGHFSLSQRHGGGGRRSQSQRRQQQRLELSQRSLMASMSQSIHARVKRNRGRAIPESRYLTLRVELVNATKDLPPALKEKSSSCRLLTSPVPTGGGTSRGASGPKKDGFVVTPLGKAKLRRK